MRVCVCACVCARVCVRARVCVCVCVCVCDHHVVLVVRITFDSLSVGHNRLSILSSPQNDTQCHYTAAECRFLLIDQHCWFQVVQLYGSTDTATSWKNSHFILTDRWDFHIVDNLSVAIHVLPMRIMISLSINEILLPWYAKCFINFRGLLFNEEMALSRLKHVLSEFTLSQSLLLPAPGYTAEIRL